MLSAALWAAIVVSPVQERVPLVLAHYMPWYQSKEVSGVWGWHWTMNHFDPDKVVDGRREVASKFFPLAGAYDSNDPYVLEYHALLMKIAGIDGAIIDWYGNENAHDYGINHERTLSVIKELRAKNLKFAICYEDQTLPQLIKLGRVKEADAVEYGRGLVEWMDRTWFKDKAYASFLDRPLLLVFGPQYFKEPEQWSRILGDTKVAVFGVNGQYGFADGGFAWPYPPEGNERMTQFYKDAKGWKGFVAGAYPRFDDVYKTAAVSEGYAVLDDNEGKTFDWTFELAVKSGSPVIQLITWNDWGEGTVIEPSVEFGYRDLERVQAWRKSVMGESFVFEPSDLRLPLRILEARRAGEQRERLDSVVKALASGDPVAARDYLNDRLD